MPLQPAHNTEPLPARQRRILVIDDEASFTRLLKINLETTGGYAVHVENNPRRALSAALAFHPDLVLLDVMMHGLDGGDVVTRFNGHDELKLVPVIFLTATVRHEEVRGRAGNFGGQRFIAKPVDLPGLLECLEGFFNDRASPAGESPLGQGH
jgi:CheY-like chemotaxis protein